jgi:DNA-binding transcriptional MerR regulator
MIDINNAAQVEQVQFPIRELARRTAVKSSTLRAWETRHNLLQPLRTESGHRLYNEADVQRILYVQELLDEGYALREVAKLLKLGIPTERAEARSQPNREQASSAWQGFQEEMLVATSQFNDQKLDNAYGNACSIYPMEMVNRYLLIPVLEQLGERWQEREAGIAEEHFFSAWLRNKLGARMHHAFVQDKGSLLICACLPGERHEIGLLVFALSALSRGYQVIYLGADMPIRQIRHVADIKHAQAVVLAGRETTHAKQIVLDIAWLSEQVSALIFVGSHFADVMKPELKKAGALPIGSDILAGLARIETRIAANPARPRAVSLHP